MTSTFETAAALSRRFLIWWGDELADFVPAAVRRWAAQEGPRTVLSLEEGRLVHYEEGRRGAVPRGELELGAGADAFRLGLRRARVGVRLPLSACLVRRHRLPAAARRDFARILHLELGRSTPFTGEEVYSDHFVEERQRAGAAVVRQVLVKRSILDPLLQRLAARGIAVDFADCWDETGKRALPVDLLRSAQPAAGSGGRRVSAVAVLAACALVLACSAVLTGLGKYDAALESVRAEAGVARAKALAVRKSLGAAEAALADIAELRRLKMERPPLVGVIDELTRLLPDEAWVRYLRLDGDRLDVTVVAPSTAEVLPVIGQSPLFGAASLTAPVSYDEAGERERATIRVRLRPPAAELKSAHADGSRR